MMKVIVGDELGLIKCIDANKKIMESKFGEIGKNNCVIGIDSLFQNSTNLLSVTHSENFYILDWKDKTIKYRQNINEKYTAQVVKKGSNNSTVLLSNENNSIDLFQFDEDLEISNYNEFETGLKNLFSIKNSYVENEIFCLGKKSVLQVYDFEQNKITWRSKNVPNDELDLMVPIWDTDLTQNKSNPNIFYTSTAFGNIRVYDRKVKPRPIDDKNIFKNRINKMIQTNCENYLVVGDTIGHLYFLDKRKNYQKVKCLFGATGAIRDVSAYENTPYIFSCGLDRFLRIYEYKKNSDMPHIYLKNKLNVVFPVEIDYKEDEEALEYYEDEEDKSDGDDEMNELSDEDSEEKKKKIEDDHTKKIKTKNKSKKTSSNEDDEEAYNEDSEGYEDEQDINNSGSQDSQSDASNSRDDHSDQDDDNDLSDDEAENESQSLGKTKGNKANTNKLLGKKPQEKHKFKEEKTPKTKRFTTSSKKKK